MLSLLYYWCCRYGYQVTGTYIHELLTCSGRDIMFIKRIYTVWQVDRRPSLPAGPTFFLALEALSPQIGHRISALYRFAIVDTCRCLFSTRFLCQIALIILYGEW